jgi:hypothetical protein
MRKNSSLPTFRRPTRALQVLVAIAGRVPEARRSEHAALVEDAEALSRTGVLELDG